MVDIGSLTSSHYINTGSVIKCSATLKALIDSRHTKKIYFLRFNYLSTHLYDTNFLILKLKAAITKKKTKKTNNAQNFGRRKPFLTANFP